MWGLPNNIGDGPSLEITHINEILKKIRINFRLGCKYSKIIIKRGTLIFTDYEKKVKEQKIRREISCGWQKNM